MPRCDGTEAWPTARGLWMCAACGHQASVIAGTIFQGTRTPLSVWFRAIWWVVSQKMAPARWAYSACSAWAATARRGRGCTSCDGAMVRPGRDRVSEEVEVDETLVGGLEAGGGRRHLGKKALVVIAAEVRGRAIGRIRMQRVADASADSLLTFVQHAVQPGSVVITDRAPELPPPAQARLSPRPEGAPWSWRVGRGGLASRPPGRVAPQALAPGRKKKRHHNRSRDLSKREYPPCSQHASPSSSTERVAVVAEVSGSHLKAQGSDSRFRSREPKAKILNVTDASDVLGCEGLEPVGLEFRIRSLNRGLGHHCVAP